MEQNQSIIGKECIIGQEKGLILDVQGDMVLIALKDVHEECTFEKAKNDTPKGAYIPKMWEMLKYIKYLQKYWPTKRIYWSSQIFCKSSSYSPLYSLELGAGDCDVYHGLADLLCHLFAGYFIKVPANNLNIIK